MPWLLCKLSVVLILPCGAFGLTLLTGDIPHPSFTGMRMVSVPCTKSFKYDFYKQDSESNYSCLPRNIDIGTKKKKNKSLFLCCLSLQFPSKSRSSYREAATMNTGAAPRKSSSPCRYVPSKISLWSPNKMEKATRYFCFSLTKQLHAVTKQRQKQVVGCTNMYVFSTNTNISGHAAPNRLVF